LSSQNYIPKTGIPDRSSKSKGNGIRKPTQPFQNSAATVYYEIGLKPYGRWKMSSMEPSELSQNQKDHFVSAECSYPLPDGWEWATLHEWAEGITGWLFGYLLAPGEKPLSPIEATIKANRLMRRDLEIAALGGPGAKGDISETQAFAAQLLWVGGKVLITSATTYYTASDTFGGNRKDTERGLTIHKPKLIIIPAPTLTVELVREALNRACEEGLLSA